MHTNNNSFRDCQDNLYTKLTHNEHIHYTRYAAFSDTIKWKTAQKPNEMCCILLTRMFPQPLSMRMTIVKMLCIDRGHKVKATNK